MPYVFKRYILRLKLVISLLFLLFLLSSCVTGIPESEAAVVYYNLGNAYFELGEYDKAINAFKYSLDLDAGLFRAGYNLSRIYIESGKIEKSIQILKELLIKDEDNSILLETLGWAYHLAGDDEKALEIYTQLLLRVEYNENALYNIGVIYWNKGEFREAYNSFYKLYSISPDDDQLLYNLGVLNIELKNTSSGISYLKAAKEKNPDNVVCLTALGDAYSELQLFSDALDNYNAALLIDKGLKDIYFKKAYILLTAIEDFDEGIQNLKNAVDLGFNDIEEIEELCDYPDLYRKDEVQEYLMEHGLYTEKTEDTIQDLYF